MGLRGAPRLGFNKEARRGWFATGLLSAWCARQPYEEIRKSSKSSRGSRNEFQGRYFDSITCAFLLRVYADFKFRRNIEIYIVPGLMSSKKKDSEIDL